MAGLESQNGAMQDGEDAALSQNRMAAGMALPSFMRSLGVKFFVLGLLVFMLSLPLFAVWLLVKDREANFRRATAEIGRQWGGAQILTGPMLEIPVKVLQPSEKEGEPPREVTRRALLAPDRLDVTGVTSTETRKRGIHEAVVYQADLAMRAVFSAPDFEALRYPVIAADWTRARIVAGISDLKGIETLAIKANGRGIENIEPGLGSAYGSSLSGLRAPAGLSQGFAETGQPLTVDLMLDLKGSQAINFVPAGDQTTVSLESPWPHPSFSGNFLPQSREIGADGFNANWSVPKLARDIPHLSLAGGQTFPRYLHSSFGVRFYQPVDFYKQVDRAVKYGVLFVSMAFLVIFVIEIVSRGRMHLVHYAMTGMMIVVFYTLLLALAEFVGFTVAYAVAAGATGAVIAAFVASLFPGRTWTVAAFGGFAALYGFLYVVLQLAEAALLVGSVTGFVILSVLMFATRDTDWGARKPLPPAEAAAREA
jgi:inner membrane protein